MMKIHPLPLFFLLTATSYSLSRLLISESLTDWFRSSLHRLSWPNNSARSPLHEKVYQLFSCYWCWGHWVTAAVFAWAWYLYSIPHAILQFFGARVLVGFLGMIGDKLES